MAHELPVFGIRAELLAALARGPVVLSSPTGSGKSPEVPRWCEGPVLVVEPRRLACRSLATVDETQVVYQHGAKRRAPPRLQRER